MTRLVANFPAVLATVAAPIGAITVTANAQLGAGYSLPSGGYSSLIVNDATTVAGANSGNQLISVAASGLAIGTIIAFNATSSGLVVSQLPSGVGISVTAGTSI